MIGRGNIFKAQKKPQRNPWGRAIYCSPLESKVLDF